ncbi:hypothetical protein BKA64DRAFT_137786 [Cadophora sp. MPI-SDFR-AT-0126]|nr:hypothetical protein BKA64DRAFT_137786 [Leotiomycetes sp. MPI-SDFR-AT-0126]
MLRDHESRFSALFWTFSIHESDTQAEYWNESCFKGCIRTVHDASIVIDHTGSLLWRSFSYYAYHPFPRGDVYQIRIDESAFLRGATLLALQTNDLLGTQDGDWFWQHNDTYFHRKNWERMLRSILLPSVEKLDETEDNDESEQESRVSDVMDVLSMTQPRPPMPPTQIGPVAKAFYEDEITGPRYVYPAT